MDKETLSHYGWIVILVLILSVLLALATPFGSFIADGFKVAYAGFDMVRNGAMDVVMNSTGGCTHSNTQIKNVTDDYTGDTVCDKCGTVLEEGKHIVPEGGQYTTADGTVYNPGDAMPEVVTTGDRYRYGDYEYCYNMKSSGYCYWTENMSQNGWGVDTIRNDKTSYGEILESIAGKSITSLSSTFRNCNQFTVAPSIPATVIDVEYAFMNCDSLLVAPELPQNITSLYYSFANCTDLHTAPSVLPEGITNMQYAFCGTSITEAPATPISVTDMHCAYYKCKLLKTAPNVPENVTTLSFTFSDCISLEGIVTIDANPSSYTSCFDLGEQGKNITLTGKSKILVKIAEAKGTKYRDITDVRHNVGRISDGDAHITGDYTYIYNDSIGGWGVRINTYKTTQNEEKYGEILKEIENLPITSLNHTFAYCSNLKEAPEIPYGVKDMNQTFFKTAITNAPTIPENVIDMSYAFSYCSNLIDAPNIPESVTKMEYIFNGCTSLKDISKLSIPSKVTSLHSAFSNCSSLTVAPQIPDNITHMYRTFANCSSLQTAPVIPKNVKETNHLFENCTSLSGIVTIDANISSSGYCTYCFSGVDFEAQGLTLTGTSGYLDTVGSTGINYCKTCNGRCQNNH